MLQFVHCTWQEMHNIIILVVSQKTLIVDLERLAIIKTSGWQPKWYIHAFSLHVLQWTNCNGGLDWTSFLPLR